MQALLSRSVRVLATLFVLSHAVPATAQLDLPDRKVRDDRAGRGAREVPRHSKSPKNSLKARVTGEGGAKEDDLSLPDRPLSLPDRSRVREVPERAGGARAGSAAPADALPTERVFEALARVERLDDPIVGNAVSILATSGESGLVAARLALADEHPPALLAALLTLIGSSDPNDWPLVRKRLNKPFPPGSAGDLVEAVLDVDPVRASPQLLTTLLDHPQGAVRVVAHRRLRARTEPSLLLLLAEPLASDRADTRLRALDLVIDIDHPQRADILFDMLTDSQARVASVALETLAGLEDDGIVEQLMRTAFSSRWILRENAYALLTLLEREDLFFEPLLDEAHVEPLLGGLASSDVFVSGACASALAGIGFRSSAHAMPWLDREVPARLVRTVAGLDFHSDSSALRPIAERRLALIAGENYGSDGPAWVRWWTSASQGFRARRAVLHANPDEAGWLVLRLRDDEHGDDYQLVGPERALAADATMGSLDPRGEVLFLTSAQARDLFELCQQEGLFGSDRLPGKRGSWNEIERTLEVELGDQAKSFHFGPRTEPWFERVTEAAATLREVNRWQRYPNPALYASRLELWRVEGAWWSDPRPTAVKERRLAEMILAWLPAQEPSERQRGLEELEEIYSHPGVASPDDFGELLDLVRAEPGTGPRVTSLVELALEALAPRGDGPSDGRGDREVGERGDLARSRRADELVETLLAAFETEAATEIARVLEAAGPQAVRERAGDRRPFLRALAGRVLARSDEPEDRELLATLLNDPDPEVESAVVRSIGAQNVTELGDDVLIRARLGRGDVRADALRAAGRMKLDGALEALRIGLQESEPDVRAAAAEGLALLEDPMAAGILVQLLGSPRTSPSYAAAWRGLRALGHEVWPELRRVVHSPEHRSHRAVALLLAREGQPDAAPALLRLLTDHPADATVAEELAVLSCVDYRGQPNPAEAWWQWWEQVVHDDAHAWFAAALLRAGIEVPPAEEFQGDGTRAAALCCLSAIGAPNEALAERARRELARMLGSDVGEIPPAGVDRDAWLYTLREVVLERRK